MEVAFDPALQEKLISSRVKEFRGEKTQSSCERTKLTILGGASNAIEGAGGWE